MNSLPHMLWTTLSGERVGPLALGGYYFDLKQWSGEQRSELLLTMAEALDAGMNHFDTASDYGGGESERLLGDFLATEPRRRNRVFVATKASIDEMDASRMAAAVERSCERLRVETVDLFYIHWPRKGKDPRPLMEGLMKAKAAGRLRHIGVSNFSPDQMRLVGQVGPVDAHQVGYNLFWRKPEMDVIPYCRENKINVIAYSAIAQGVMTGKFGELLELRPDDGRRNIVFFGEKVWPLVHVAVQALRGEAAAAGRPLVEMAIRWVLAQPGVGAAVVGARNREQLRMNLSSLSGDIDEMTLRRMGAIGEQVARGLPDYPNMYNYLP